jgi:O-antigen ligase
LLILAFIVIAFMIYKRSLFLASLGLIVSLIISVASFELGKLTQFFRYIVPSEVWSRLSVQGFNSSERVEIYQCFIEIIEDKPLVGWGLGNSAPECEHRLNGAAASVNHAHNILLQLAADIGLPFTLVLSCLMAYILFSSVEHLMSMENQGDQDLKFGFFIAVFSVIFICFFTAGTLASYRLGFLFWLCLAISDARIPDTYERSYPSTCQENSVEKFY